ncbi:hypothetical protein HK101_010997, partial [Irineochytrium annulatum]
MQSTLGVSSAGYQPSSPTTRSTASTPKNTATSPTIPRHGDMNASSSAGASVVANNGIRLVLNPHKDTARTVPSAIFEPVERQLNDGHVLKIGRQVRAADAAAGGAAPPSPDPAAAASRSPALPPANDPASPTTATTGTAPNTLLAALTGLYVSAPGQAATAPGANTSAPTLPQPSPNVLDASSAVTPVQPATPVPVERLPPLPAKQVDFVSFKSKVVSRNHAELWYREGQVYLRDTGSSSGTFLNRMRLSPSGKLSRPYPLRDGDVIQLGIDYQGRPEDIYKCVIMKISLSGLSATVSQRKRENPA